MTNWSELEELHVHGYVHVRKTRGLKISDSTLRRAAQRHGWDRPHQGVVALGGARDGPEGTLAAALERVGQPAYVSLWSAAWLYGLVRTPPSRVALLLPHGRRVARVEGVDFSRSRTLVPQDLTKERDLPVVSMARLLCQLARILTEAQLRAFVIDARQRQQVTLQDIADTADRMGNAAGLARLRRTIGDLDVRNADSVFELRMRRKLRSHGFRPDPGQAAVPAGDRVLHIDIPFSSRWVGIECLGLGSHSEREHLETDARRSNALANTAWRILMATWSDLDRTWPQFRVALERALNRDDLPQPADPKG